MAQTNARVKTILFGLLGLFVFSMPFLSSMSQKSKMAQNTAARTTMERPSVPLVLWRPVMPNELQILTMTETHMNALFEAGRTGNYGPLHKLGAYDFQNKNSLDRLQQIFAGFLKNNVDLKQIERYVPEQTSKPFFDKNGMLHVAGHYPTKPMQIHYDLTFQKTVDGAWRLFGLSVKTVPVS